MENNQNRGLAVLNNDLETLSHIVQLSQPGVDAKTLVMTEIMNLEMISLTTPAILECIPLTIMHAVRTTLKQNLSLDPQLGLTYVKTRSIKVKNEQDKDVWVKALEITPTANGLISIARQCGRLLDHKRPVVTCNAANQVVKVSFEMLLPSLPAPRWETVEFDVSDFHRWRLASHKENSRGKQVSAEEHKNLVYANPNYTAWNGGLDPEFARAKAIRHALKKKGANFNEQRAAASGIIATAADKQFTVEPEVDRQATADDQFTEAEVITETKAAPAAADLDGDGGSIFADKFQGMVNETQAYVANRQAEPEVSIFKKGYFDNDTLTSILNKAEKRQDVVDLYYTNQGMIDTNATLQEAFKKQSEWFKSQEQVEADIVKPAAQASAPQAAPAPSVNEIEL
jgi:hypothetical protein